MKIKISVIMALLIFHIVFVNLYYVPYYNFLTYIFMGILFLFLIIKIKYFFNNKYKKINILVLLFITTILLSSFINNLNPLRGVLAAIKILEIFWFFEYIYQIKEEKAIIKIFTELLGIYIISNDLLMFIKPDLFLTHEQYYLLGNKFQISYLHILLLTFYSYNNFYINQNKRKLVFIILYLACLAISIYTECTTAVVGTILFGLFMIIFKNKKVNSKLITITLIVSCSILVLFSSIIQFKPVEYLIVNILHEDITLTGRTIIYQEVFGIISSNWLLGYGYGNSYEIMHKAISFPNTQNALLEYWLTTGIVGMLFLILLIYNILKNYKKKINPIVIYILVFSILGSVEITIDIIFLALLALINIGKNEKREESYNERIIS